MKKLVIWICTLALLISTALPGIAAYGANTTVIKKEVSREIAVVFDNSGSMYSGGKTAWCAATYAVEVFAAMMNQTDVVKVFPMWKVESGGVTYSRDNPIVIRSTSDIKTVHEMYTPNASGTPIETIDDAYNDLRKSSADEKWLVVLTDGAQWYQNDQEKSVEESRRLLQDKLGNYSNSVNVQVLTIGTDLKLTESAKLHSDNCSMKSADILASLTAVCNSIFGRDKLPNASISSSTLTFDVSMNRIIVFSQGEGAKINSLKASDGSVVQEVSGSRYDARYSTLGSNRGKVYDDSLMGTVVTFQGAPAGKYTLDYTGNLEVYYEPNVSVKVIVRDAEGAIVDGNNADAKMYLGDYTIEYGLIDNETGEYTNSSLLGDVQYSARYTLDGKTCDFKSGETIHLDAEGDFSFEIDAVYLDDYSIKTTDKDYFKFGQLSMGLLPKPANALGAQLSGSEKLDIREFDSAATYSLKISCGGKAMTQEQLQSVADSLEVTVPEHIGWQITGVDAASSSIGLKLNLKNGIVKESLGTFQLSVTAKYQEKGAEQTVATAVQEITVENSDPGLEMKVSVADDYFLTGELEEEDPFMLEFSKDGQPLSDEEVQALYQTLQLSVEGSPIAFEATVLPGKSAIEVRLRYSDGQSAMELGKYALQAKVTGKDVFGDPVEVESSKSFSVNSIPKWLKITLYILGFLLWLLIIWLISSIRVLPKRITQQKGLMLANGKRFEQPAKVQFNRSGKTVSATTPEIGMFPMLPQIKITLDLIPITPMRKPSEEREARIKNIKIGDDMAVRNVKIGKNTYTRNRQTGELERTSKGDLGVLKNGTVCSVDGKFGENNTGFIYTFKFKFTGKKKR